MRASQVLRPCVLQLRPRTTRLLPRSPHQPRSRLVVPPAGAARNGSVDAHDTPAVGRDSCHAPASAACDAWHAPAVRGAAAGLAVAALSFALLQGRASAAEARAAAAAPTTTTVFSAPSLTVSAGDAQGALKYRLLQLFAAPTYGKVLAVVTVAAPILLLGSFLYRKTAQGETSWSESFLRPYSVLLNCPGSTVESERGPATDFVLHIVHLVGVLTFAAVLGVIVDDISTQVDTVRHGNYAVHERGHTVVLGWNAQALPVLQQMALAKAESGGVLFSTPVVVLADRDKAEMDEEIADALDGSGLTVITREGSPAKPAEQHKAAAAAASTVVLLWPSDKPPATASAHTAAALSALRAAGGARNQKVVVQNLGEAARDFDAIQIAVDLAQSAPGGRHVASLTSSGNERIHQMMAQVANQPGLEDVFADLLEYEGGQEEEQEGRGHAHAGGSAVGDIARDVGAEFYVAPTPEHLQGKPYRHVRRSYDAATVVGWVAPDAGSSSSSGGAGALRLNPADGEAVPAGSQLVFVAGDMGDALTPLEQPYEVSAKRVGRGGGRTSRGARPRNITCLCFSRAAAASLARSVGEFCSRGTQLTLVCEDPDMDALKRLKLSGVRLRVVAGSPASKRVLSSKAARLADADAVVVCGLGAIAGEAADVQVVASVLQLQSLAASHGREAPLSIVASLHEANSGCEDVLWHATLSYHAELKAAAANRAAAELQRLRAKARKPVTGDELAYVASTAASMVGPPVSLHLLRPDELKAGMITQTAVAPELAEVFSELFTQTGHELYLRQPRAAYGLPLNRPLLWKDVAEAVRRHGETALGVSSPAAVASSGSLQLGHGQEVHLGLVTDQLVTLREGDQLVVIALE